MRTDEPSVPLHSVVLLPRWLMLAGAATSIAAILAGVVLIVLGLSSAATGGPRGGLIGGGAGCLIGGAGALFGTMRDWHRRLPANVLLRHVQNDVPLAFHRRVFWPAVVILAIGVAAGLVWNHRAIWQGVVQPSAMLAFLSGVLEVIRRHSTRGARAVFALYADGVLDPTDARAIDDARAKDAAFDAELRSYLAIGEQVRALVATNGGGERGEGGEGREGVEA